MERQIQIARGTWRILLGLAILLFIETSALSATRYVPSRDYRTIQSAIDAAVNGDVVVVAPGTYTGPNNVNLDFKGKAITVRSQINPANPDWNIIAATVIDCGGEPPAPIAEDPNRAANRAFWFHTSEDPNSKVLGFTIRNGYARGPKGADGRFGIDPPAPRISVDPDDPNGPPQAENGKVAPGSGILLNGYGGAILCGDPDNTSVFASPTIQYCVMTECIVTGAHGGNGAAGQSGTWTYQPPYDVNDPNATPPNIVEVDDGQWGGDAISGSGNGYGGAIACLGGSSPLISDCIIKDNFAHGGCGGDGGTGGNAVSNPPNASPPNYSGGNESFGGNAGAGFGDGIGGGIYAESGSSPIITNCVFSNNIATTGIRAAGGPAGQGDAIPADQGGPATDGADGYVVSTGGIAGGAAYYSHPSTANFTNCTFTANMAYEAYIYYDPLSILGEDISAYTVGGAVYSDISNNVTINTCDFKSNMGGAIYCDSNCTLSIDNAYDPNHNCLFITNSDTNDGSDLDFDIGIDFGSGGAIYVGPNGIANIQNCVFTSNLAKNDGGALKCLSNLVIKNCSFGGNTARNGYGGATDLYLPGATTPLTIDANNCSFSGNQAPIGGGFSSDNFTATFANCYFIGNTARESGGLDLWYGNITFSNGIIKDNIATDGYGGGLSCYSTAVQILHSTIMDNLAAGSFPTAGCGGAIYFEGQASPHRVFNCLITGNSATVSGGAIYCYTATPEIKNCTFDNDFAGGFGGAIFSNFSSLPQITNCIFRNCNGHAIHEEDYGGDANATYCLFYNNSGGEYYDSGTRFVYMGAGQVGSIPSGSNNLYGDPLFVSGDLGSYYLSQTSAGQSSNSPALNKGSGTSIGLGLNTYTTATNNMGDIGLVDIGFHYRRSIGVPTFHLTASVVGGHGTVAPTGGTYYAGTIVTLTAAPNVGWMVKSWTGTDNDLSTDVNNSVVMYTDRTVTVQFRKPRTLLVSVGGGAGYYSDIQDAVLDANDGDTIIVYPGIYYSAYFGQILVVDRSVLITSRNPDDPCCVAATIIDGFNGNPFNEGDNNFGVFFTPGADNKTVLNGFTIRNCGGTQENSENGNRQQGHPDGYDGECIQGPAIITYPGAAPIIKNCVIRDNLIIGGNGGNGEGATITANAGRGGWGSWARGGAVYCGPFSSPTFINCQIIDNQAIGGNGGNGGNEAVNGGYPNYGGSWSRAGSMDSPAYDIDPTNLNIMSIIDGTQLWELWEWDMATSYWPMFGDANRTSYFGNYRWYSGYGGGAYCDMGSNVTFVDCLISGNLAQGGMSGQGGLWTGGRPIEPLIPYEIPSFGGGVYCAADAAVTFTGCTITDNNSSPPTLVDPADPDSGLRFHLDPYLGHGGGVCAEDTATVLFDNCTFSENRASVGGGLNWADANPDVNDCNFISNSAYHGGGLFGEHGPATIRGCNIANNEAVPDPALDEEILGTGGGVHGWAVEVNLIDCNISSNMAEYSGGGVYLGGETAPSLFNCLVTDNSAGSLGGGVSVEWYLDCNIVNCTIAGNRVSGEGYGGGLYCSYNSYANVINSIIWNNTGGIGAQGAQLAVGTGFEYDPRPSTVDVTYSDIQDTTDPNAFGARREVLDLVFCIDTTGSMGDDIAAVQAAANQITSAIAAEIPDFRISVVEYKDFNQADYGSTADYPYRTVVGFTTNTSEVVAAIDSLTASGGADWPESVYAALMHCLNHSLLAERLAGQLYGASEESLGPGAWRPGNVLRVILLMGDAPPHDPEPFTNYTLGDIIAEARGAEPKRIMPLLIGADPNAASYFGSLASGTGGTLLQAAGAGEVVQAIMDAIDLVSRVPDPLFVDTGCSLNWDPNTYAWGPGSHNINEDPLFIAGYCLSQFAADQVAESNCVDGGSDLASVFGLDRYTTRVDSVMDAGIVDMGYHYRPFTPHQYMLTFTSVNVSEPNWPVLTIVEPTPSEPNFYEGLHDWYSTVHLIVSGTYNPADYQVHWTGTDNDDSDQSTNTVTMNNDKQVSVRLVKTRYNLTIGVDGGNGRLSAGWVEGTTSYTIEDPCTHSVKFGTVVQLTAEPIEGYRVRKWSGTDNDTSRAFNNTVTMNLDSDRTVTVELGPPVTLIVPADYPTIQEAVSAAEVGDTIVVYGGTYEGNIDLQGKEITLVSANPDDPNVIAATIIDCNENGRGFIFNSGEDVNTIVNGFTIINGNVIDGNYGGGIFIDSGSSPTIMNMVISDCNADGDPGFGGGIYINANSSPIFINGAIINCSADRGGGAFCDSNSSPTFRHCTFSDNLADLGGGLLCGSNSSTTIIDCNFADNDANNGGGLYGEPNSLVTIDESIFTDNTASGYGGAIFWLGWMEIFDTDFVSNSSLYGGGMFCAYSAETTIVGCTIRQNRAGPVFDPNDPDDPNASIDGKGGGIFCFAASALVRDCIISHNVANASGGAIYFAGSSDSQQLSNCLITNNFAGRDGGGVSANWYANTVLANCTFAGNAAPGTFGQTGNTGMGGGLYTSYESDTTVIDSIFWNNFALKGSEMGVWTGFEHDKRPAKLTVSYSDVKGGQYGIYVDTGCVLNWGAGNIDSNPLFVTGMFGDYYLSQTAVGDPNQTENSPCVDVGSDYTGNVGLIRRIDPAGRIVAYTTRTDGELDHGVVDMGYHYRTVEPCRFCDLVYDGIINFQDYAVIAAHWLQSGCFDLNGWCQGGDLTFDRSVDLDDLVYFTECWLVADTKAPVPNPSEWEIEPYLASSTSAKMTARTAFDEWGWDVEYYFDCIYGNGHDSGWQASRAYQDTGLPIDAIYGYRVRTRDELGNQTEWSVIRYAGELDTIPPAPAPTWAVAPYATGSASIAMEATVAYDDSGVSYGFWNVTRDPAGDEDDIVWQTGTQFTDVNLEPNTTYGYRVKARDGSLNQNETAWSAIAYATTFGAVDSTPPTPDPAQWDLTVDANGYDGRPRKVNIPGTSDYKATMRAVQATDPSGVEYRFVCNDSRFSSGWQSQPAIAEPWTYQVPIGGVYVVTKWYVIVRDQSPNYNETDPSSPTWPAEIREPP